MSFYLLNNVVTVSPSIPTTILSGASASATNGSAVDTKAAEGNLLIALSSTAASASDTFTLTVEESADGSTSWGAVPSDALINPDTGAAATFTVVDDAATAATKNQVLALRKNRIKRYIRAVMTYAGTSISGAYAVNVVINNKVANWS